jgi:hypothetical protein
LRVTLLSDKSNIKIPHQVISRAIGDAIKEIIFGRLFPNPFIASAERTGAAIFRKELNFARNRLLEQVSTMENDLNPLNGSGVKISGVPEGTLAIKIDKFSSPDKLFSGTNGECKRADFALIADNGKKKRILIIELKRGNDPRSQIERQLKGAACVIEYCKEIARTFYKFDNPLSGFEIRYISFGHTSIAKRKTRVGSDSNVHDRPDRMMKISSPNHVHFNHLAG